MTTNDHAAAQNHRLPLRLPYRHDLTAALAGLVNLASDPTFQRELTALATSRFEYVALRVLGTMSFTQLRRPAELAVELGLSRSQVTKALDRLEADGLIERRRLDVDGRGVVVEITADGREVTQALYDTGDQFLAQIVRDWSTEDIDRFTQLVSRFTRDGREAVEGLHQGA